jgi:thioredoxin reductase (NADPH)
LDKDGFVLTGAATGDKWKAVRPPHGLETSRPGIFAAGDVRSGSVKRVGGCRGRGRRHSGRSPISCKHFR